VTVILSRRSFDGEAVERRTVEGPPAANNGWAAASINRRALIENGYQEGGPSTVLRRSGFACDASGGSG